MFPACASVSRSQWQGVTVCGPLSVAMLAQVVSPLVYHDYRPVGWETHDVTIDEWARRLWPESQPSLGACVSKKVARVPVGRSMSVVVLAPSVRLVPAHVLPVLQAVLDQFLAVAGYPHHSGAHQRRLWKPSQSATRSASCRIVMDHPIGDSRRSPGAFRSLAETEPNTPVFGA